MVMLEACIFGTVIIGFLGLIYKQNLLTKILAMDVMSTGVITYYCLIAARTGFLTPIATEEKSPLTYADPVPQAVILTAIVIGLSIQALMLVAVMKLARENPTLEAKAIEKQYWP
jgi:multicomponent Na+:H+ antiporter subunit C